MDTEHKFEIFYSRSNTWIEVDEYIFRSWGGRRMIDGEEWVGPTYYLGSEDVAIAPLAVQSSR